MKLVFDFAVICLVLLGLKIVWAIFKKVGSKDNINAGLGKANEAAKNAAKNVAEKWKNRKVEEKPTATIHY